MSIVVQGIFLSQSCLFPTGRLRRLEATESLLVVGVFMAMCSGCAEPNVNQGKVGSSTCSSEIRNEQIARIVQTGEAEFVSGGRIRLAGLRIRPIDETQEPNGLKVAVSIVNFVGRQQRIEQYGSCGEAIVYYRQPVLYRDKYIPLWWVFMPQYQWVTLNEMLIYVGLASYQECHNEIPPDIDSALKRAQSEYERAVSRGYRRIEFSQLEKSPELIYWYRGGFVPSLAMGDLRPSQVKQTVSE